eukprot:COSAG06_NODE_44904_length_359_cov_0.934615_1_plen_26_part_10
MHQGTASGGVGWADMKEEGEPGSAEK